MNQAYFSIRGYRPSNGCRVIVLMPASPTVVNVAYFDYNLCTVGQEGGYSRFGSEVVASWREEQHHKWKELRELSLDEGL